jgi:hypothetical protein
MDTYLSCENYQGQLLKKLCWNFLQTCASTEGMVLTSYYVAITRFFFGPKEFRTCLLNCTNLADVHNITRGLLSLRKPVGSGLNRVQEIHVARDGADYYSELPYLVFLNGRCKKTAPLLYQSTRFKFLFCGKTRNYVDYKSKCFCCKNINIFQFVDNSWANFNPFIDSLMNLEFEPDKKKTSFHSVLSNTTFNFRDQSRPIL